MHSLEGLIVQTIFFQLVSLALKFLGGGGGGGGLSP